MAENYYDGAWRPVVGDPDEALDKLRSRGFEFGADDAGRLMARWPIAPSAPLTFSSAIAIEYWRGEVLMGCAASLERLRRIVAERGADYDRTIEALQD